MFHQSAHEVRMFETLGTIGIFPKFVVNVTAVGVDLTIAHTWVTIIAIILLVCPVVCPETVRYV